MTDIQETPEAEAEVTPVKAARYSTQAAWDADRAERKAKAAKTVAKNAKEAAKAKREAQAQGATPGLEDFNQKAKEIEARINAKTDTEKEAS